MSQQPITMVRSGSSLKMTTEAAYGMELENVLENPMCCGFLLRFCEDEYNAENLHFIMAVDKFKDFVRSVDSRTWKKSWQDIDKLCLRDVDVSQDSEKVKSTKIEFDDSSPWQSSLDKKAMQLQIQQLWDSFLSNNAPNQICIPARVYAHTIERIRLYHIYGPEIFDEACLDPIKTMKRYIWPRFIVSDVIKKMATRMQECKPLPTSVHFSIEPPTTYFGTPEIINRLSDDHKFELPAFLRCRFLFEHLNDYLRSIVSSENLLCVRAIDIFENLYGNGRHEECIAQAWTIYKFFIAYGAAFEISVHHLHRKEIMLNLATPTLNMFETAKRSAVQALKFSFEQYRTTTTYKGLPRSFKDAVRDKKDKSACGPRLFSS